MFYLREVLTKTGAWTQRKRKIAVVRSEREKHSKMLLLLTRQQFCIQFMSSMETKEFDVLLGSIHIKSLWVERQWIFEESVQS